MKIIYDDGHRRHAPPVELGPGSFIAHFETPDRADLVLKMTTEAGLGPVMKPEDFGIDPVLRVHDKGYFRFLEDAYRLWKDEGYEGPAIPFGSAFKRNPERHPTSINGLVCHYIIDGAAPIDDGTYEAALQAANVAMTGLDLILNKGESSAFSLCRPPGHHAGPDYCGGYCYLNNAAIAAQAALDHGLGKIAVLDIDYHHGNGTQEIFWERDDVFFLSIHGEPGVEYPYFTGYADETGEGKGEGFNVNYPLPHGTGFDVWGEKLDDALGKIAGYGPDLLIVSLGVDTFKEDPISEFKLDSPDYRIIGQRIAALNKKTLFIMEGGYAVDAIGTNVANLLSGFSESAQN